MHLLLAFLLVPVVEIALFVQVGDLIGLWPTLALVVLTAVAGTALMRREGFAVLGRTQAALARGELPVGEVLDGACVLVGGVLLVVPGFLTDALGVLLLIPAVRRRLGKAALGWALSRGGIRVHARSEGGPRGPVVIDGEFSEVRPTGEDPVLHLPPRPRVGGTGAGGTGAPP
jgi:UPF0716 protein FxsA